MRERGELQRGGISPRTRLHKRAVLQRSGPGRFFKGLGVAKKYCSPESNGEGFVRGPVGQGGGGRSTIGSKDFHLENLSNIFC